MTQIFSVVSVVVLLYHLKDVISIVLSKKIYLTYFGVPLGDQDKSWTPHQVCTTCVETLRSWSQGKNAKLKFGVPMVWREPKKPRGCLLLLPRKCQRIQQEKQATLAIPKHTFCYATDSP